jgi:3-dehydroquinate synthase
MRILEVKAESKTSRILFGEKFINLKKYIDEKRAIILTDSNLIKYYQNIFPKDVPIIEIGLGEKNKTMKTIEKIMEKLVEYEADRSSFLVAIGGGIVCDVAGFAASIYMRGISFGFVSTTLLAQVDASVGGKNGVNFEGYKNMVGVFNQPDFVLCDNTMFSTLDQEEFRSGFAEIIKAGIIKDASLFDYCRQHVNAALANEEEVITRMIFEAVQIKARVVETDEKEKGERRLLNFGHTFAHALEKNTGMLHGRAVSVGMVLAAKVSMQRGMISRKEVDELIQVLETYGLPTQSDIPFEKLYHAMHQDKKREGDTIHMVLLQKIGKAVTCKLTYSELKKILDDLHSNIG